MPLGGANWKIVRGEDGKTKMRLKSKSLVFPIGAFKEDSEASFGDSSHGTLQNELYFGCITQERQGLPDRGVHTKRRSR